MSRRFALTLALLSLFALSFIRPVYAQRDDNALSNAEIEQLRETAYVANDRVLLFIKLLDTRTKAIEDLFAHPRKPGREQDTHDLLEQFTSIANELEDNLDDYGTRHRDVRKALPKLNDAIERWSTAVRTPPEDEAYSVSRKLALESLRDLHDDSTQLMQDQKTWFAAHPPAKEDKNSPFEIPR